MDTGNSMVSWLWVTQVWVWTMWFPNPRPEAIQQPVTMVSQVFYGVVMSLLNTLTFRIFFFFSFFINFSYFHVLQLSKNGKFNGS